MIRAELVAVGTELVSGQRVDTNSPWLAQRLAELGITTRFQTIVGDDMAENHDALRLAIGRADLVLIGGGLGPTYDDLTRQVVAEVAGVPLVEVPEARASLEAFFAGRRRPMPERNLVQTQMPEGAEVLANPIGTAPGFLLRIGSAVVAALPGVPVEMKRMFDEQLAPRLKARFPAERVLAFRKVNLFGKGESEVEAMAPDLTARGRVPEVGITAHDATISFRIAAEGSDEIAAGAAMQPTLERIRERFGDLIVGQGDDDVAEALVAQLTNRQATVAVAESCTGGLVAVRLTDVSGVSPFFLGGVVSYSNAAKVDLLGVPADLIAAKGAVSPEVARAMAEGVRQRFSTDLGLAITGVAGPGGGTPEKPVGTVYIGLANAAGSAERRLDLGPEQPRDVIRSRSAKHVMNWARLHLLKHGKEAVVPHWEAV